jgi:hypothetical protein
VEFPLGGNVLLGNRSLCDSVGMLKSATVSRAYRVRILRFQQIRGLVFWSTAILGVDSDV